MRDDAVGFFWEDLQTRATKSSYARPMAPIPETGWTTPTEFPNLKHVMCLGLDTETKDIALPDKGPGFRRPGEEHAHLVGISVGTLDGGRWYFPMRHEVCPEQNMNPDNVLAWARDNLCTPGQEKVGANIMYDIDALWSEGVPVTGPFIDVQHAECLLDENRYTYNLDALLGKHFGETKVKDQLQSWIERSYGDEGNYRANIYRSPPSLVGPYAEGDVDGPLRLRAAQAPLLAKENLTELYDLENELLGPLVRMRQRGVRVDIEYAKKLDDELTIGIAQIDAKLAAVAGKPINVNSKSDLERLFKASGIELPRTAPSAKHPNGQPSITKLWLEHSPHPAAVLINERRKLEKYRNTFVRGYVLGLSVADRLHALFHPLKGDENGTVSGRFSSSLPNLQNIPARDEYWGPKLRALFIPEDGELWGRHDWSQIEYRFLVHYARKQAGGDVARAMYQNDPDTDFHEMTLDLVAPVAQWDISTPVKRKQQRKPVKNINFGLCYGMGEPKLAADLGLNDVQAATLFKAYHTAVPFVKDLYSDAQTKARTRGYIVCVDQRRAHFDLYEPRYNPDNVGRGKPLPYEEAVKCYGRNVTRAGAHKALNRLLQGSAAGLMKRAMRDMYRAGVQNVLGDMLLTCHDETGHSVPPTPAGQEALNEVKHIMETCMTLRVPIISEQSLGANWGECK